MKINKRKHQHKRIRASKKRRVSELGLDDAQVIEDLGAAQAVDNKMDTQVASNDSHAIDVLEDKQASDSANETQANDSRDDAQAIHHEAEAVVDDATVQSVDHVDDTQTVDNLVETQTVDENVNVQVVDDLDETQAVDEHAQPIYDEEQAIDGMNETQALISLEEARAVVSLDETRAFDEDEDTPPILDEEQAIDGMNETQALVSLEEARAVVSLDETRAFDDTDDESEEPKDLNETFSYRAYFFENSLDVEVEIPMKVVVNVGTEGVKRFLSDEERELLVSVPQDIVPPELLETLVKLQRTDYKENDIQRHRTIAESFPAIVYTFGPTYWIHIKAIYMSFCEHESPYVRMKMAQSLHQVAHVLGQQLTVKDLYPVFQQFSRGPTEIQQALLKNLSAFVEKMPKESRHLIAAELNVFNTYDVNNQWRLRFDFIQQLTHLVKQFKPYEINDYLVPFALAFTADKIAEIRLSAIRMLAEILAIFIKHEHQACKHSGRSISSPNSMPLSEKLLEEIQKGFWKTKNWRRRQSFAMMMRIMLEFSLISRKKFCFFFKNFLVELTLEDIPNIRQYFCKIVELIDQDRLESINSDLHSTIRSKLHQMAANDPDLEIRMMARVVLGTMDKTKDEVDYSSRTITSSASETSA